MDTSSPSRVRKEENMTLNDVYADLLSARRKLDAYNFVGRDAPFCDSIRLTINEALSDLDRRFAIEIAASR